MRHITIWLSGEIPKKYQRCIDSQREVYPDLIVITDWGNCPVKRPEDDRFTSDILRAWIMTQHDEAQYMDADILLKGKLSFCQEGEPSIWVSHCHGIADQFILGHRNRRGMMTEIFNCVYLDGSGSYCEYGRLLLSVGAYWVDNNEAFEHLKLTSNVKI